jgi:predicted AlkP superfamily phosphohydrolase/phosphomutase
MKKIKRDLSNTEFSFKYTESGGVTNRYLLISYNSKTNIITSESYDKMISDLNKLINKVETTEIEKRIINALDFFGMIENITSLRMKFLLVVFALEGLILSGDDKDYSIRKKLPEKIAFLILEPSNWE